MWLLHNPWCLVPRFYSVTLSRVLAVSEWNGLWKEVSSSMWASSSHLTSILHNNCLPASIFICKQLVMSLFPRNKEGQKDPIHLPCSLKPSTGGIQLVSDLRNCVMQIIFWVWLGTPWPVIPKTQVKLRFWLCSLTFRNLKNHIFLKEKNNYWKAEKETNIEIFHLLAHSLNSPSGGGWIRLKMQLGIQTVLCV